MPWIDPPQYQPEYKWKARVSWASDGRSTAYARTNSFQIEKQASFKDKDPYPSAIEYLLGALGGDIAAGFHLAASRSGVLIDNLEVSLSGGLNNPLVLLGVIGEKGHPGLETIEGRIYVSTDADEDKIQTMWGTVQNRSPLINTLKRCVDLKFDLVITQ